MTLKMETCSSTYQIHGEMGLGLNSKPDKAKSLPLYWISKIGRVDYDRPYLLPFSLQVFNKLIII